MPVVRTVDDEVKHRVETAGLDHLAGLGRRRAAFTVRYAVSVVDLPATIARSPSDGVSVAMSARGSSTRLTGRTSS